MGGGLSVRNENNFDILVCLSLAGVIYHWEVISSNSTHYFDCGQVWFTVTAVKFDKEYSKEPKVIWQVLKFLGYIAGGVVTGVSFGVAGAAIASAVAAEAAIATVGTTAAVEGAAATVSAATATAIAAEGTVAAAAAAEAAGVAITGATTAVQVASAASVAAAEAATATAVTATTNAALSVVGTSGVVTRILREELVNVSDFHAHGVYANGKTVVVKNKNRANVKSGEPTKTLYFEYEE